MEIYNKSVKHTLKKGDTLESVAQEFNVSIDRLMIMHNVNVEIYDKIISRFEGFPKHLQEIYVLQEVLQAVEENAKRKTGYVIFNKPYYQKKTYGFALENFENDTLKSKIHYEIEIVFIKNEQNQKIIEVNRKQIYTNNKEPESVIEQLADAISKTIYPLQLKLESSGEIKAIENQKEILKRWTEKKDTLLEYYKGEAADRIIDKSNNYFINEEVILESLSKNWFFNLFFKPIYGSYSSKREIQYNSTFPLFENNQVEYKMIQNLEDAYTETDKLVVNSKGKAFENESIEDEKNDTSLKKSQSETEIKYKLNDADNSIFSVIGTFTTKISQEKNNKIQVEIYQQ